MSHRSSTAHKTKDTSVELTIGFIIDALHDTISLPDPLSLVMEFRWQLTSKKRCLHWEIFANLESFCQIRQSTSCRSKCQHRVKEHYCEEQEKLLRLGFCIRQVDSAMFSLQQPEEATTNSTTSSQPLQINSYQTLKTALSQPCST